MFFKKGSQRNRCEELRLVTWAWALGWDEGPIIAQEEQ